MIRKHYVNIKNLNVKYDSLNSSVNLIYENKAYIPRLIGLIKNKYEARRANIKSLHIKTNK